MTTETPGCGSTSDARKRTQPDTDPIANVRALIYAQGFPHNNCGGACVRAGQAQWELLLRTNPERYAAEEAQEESLRADLGKDVAILRDRRGGTTKPLPLRLFRTRLEAQSDLFDADDFGGCGCMSLPMTQEAPDA